MFIKIAVAAFLAVTFVSDAGPLRSVSPSMLQAVYGYVKDHGGENRDVALRSAWARIRNGRLEIVQRIRVGFFTLKEDDACSVHIDPVTWTVRGTCRTTDENFVTLGNLITAAQDIIAKRELVRMI